MSASRGRMLSELRLVQEAMPGLMAADSLAFVLGYLVAQEAIRPADWRRAMEALGAQHPERRAAMDAALAERSQAPLLRVVPSMDGPARPVKCAGCGQRGDHAPWCPLD